LTSTLTLASAYTGTCCSTTFPATGYSTTPIAAPSTGVIGISMYGENIYGPLGM